jgi:tRNA 2-thiouridine synthesizing protein E
MELVVDGQVLPTNRQGFLLDAGLWTPQVAQALAERESICLTEAHWEIMYFMRAYYADYKHLPNMRMFVAAVRKQFGEAKGNSRYLHQLFPQSALKYACKLAGLPKPPSCL